MNQSQVQLTVGTNHNGIVIEPLEDSIENLRRLGLSEEELKKLFETIDAIIENRLDALLNNMQKI